MGTTIAVAVRKALTAQLATVVNATTGMSDVSVGFQFPIANAPREVVWTSGGSLSFTPASLRAGRNYLDEQSSFDLMIRSQLVNDTPEAAAERAAAISLVAADWINDHKSGEILAIPGLNWIAIDGEGDLAEYPIDSGYGAGIRLPIKFRARLT